MVSSARFSRSIRRSFRWAAEKGFSLVEILIVVSIMALLVAVVGPNVMRQFDKSKVKTARIQIEQIRAALDIYSVDVGRYPDEREGLKALVEQPGGVAGWQGPYLRDGRLPLDPWGRPFELKVAANGALRIVATGAPSGEETAVELSR
jgi:general secretion pathway protein G